MRIPHPSGHASRLVPVALAALLAAAGPATPVRAQEAAQGLQRLTIDQVAQIDGPAPTVRVYFGAVDDVGEPVGDLVAAELAPSLGDRPMRVDRLARFSEAGEGIAYLLLVDVSKSLSPAQFDRIRVALGEWIDALGPADRAAIVAFGSAVRLAADFTGDRVRLAEALGRLGPTDDETLLHRALVDALDLAGRRDSDLPVRRVAVVLTDGRDEGSGLTVDDVVERLRRSSIPIYAIGYSQLQEPDRSDALSHLLRFATLSGGTFLEAERGDPGSAYAALHRAIADVWVADLACPDCRGDGGVHRLQLTVRRGRSALSQGVDLRVLPLAGAAPEPPAPPGRAPSFWDRFGLAALVGVALLAALTTFFALRRRTSGGKPAPAPAAAARSLAAPAAPVDSAPAVTPSPPAVPPVAPAPSPLPAIAAVPLLPAPSVPPAVAAAERPPREPAAPEPVAPLPLRVRLIVLRGSQRGHEFSLVLRRAARVGSRSTCDCVLAGEAGVAPEQFELTQEDRQIKIRNLSKEHPTLLNGHPVGDQAPLRSGDLVGTQQLVLRAVYF